MRFFLLVFAVASALAFCSTRSRAGDPMESSQSDARIEDAAPANDSGADLTQSSNDAGAPVEATSTSAVVDAAAPSTTPNGRGFAFGIRAGASLPVGSVNQLAVSDVVSSSIPITVDLGYFLNDHFYLGVSFLYGFATVSGSSRSTCPSDPDVSCSARQLRVTALAAWHFRPREIFSPWVGLGMAYDVVNLNATDDTGASVESAALHGFEFLVAQTGFEIRPKPFWGFGPYAEFAGGHYVSTSGSSVSVQAWLTAGVRMFTTL